MFTEQKNGQRIEGMWFQANVADTLFQHARTIGNRNRLSARSVLGLVLTPGYGRSPSRAEGSNVKLFLETLNDTSISLRLSSLSSSSSLDCELSLDKIWILAKHVVS